MSGSKFGDPKSTTFVNVDDIMSHGTKTIRQDHVIAPNEIEIIDECENIKNLLLAKNRAYGDAALNPVRMFSKADPVEQIKVRIDDKLSRLARGSNAEEDVELDLLGYLILLRIARKKAAK